MAPKKKTENTTQQIPPEKKSECNTSPSDKGKKKTVSFRELANSIILSLSPEPPDDANKKRDNIICRYLKEAIEDHDIAKGFNILILHDEGRMVKSDADNIYSASIGFTVDKPLLLVLYSIGGVVGSAYLIGKLCRECSNGKFVVVVPRQAKSAATLICCAADEIHMGSLSELGPIDPQIENLPALGLKSSVEHIADLLKEYPNASDMFAKYLHLSLDLIHLGYYERVAESATQYAERLLKTHSDKLKGTPKKIANDLVYSYKDHGFVIDKAEAIDIFSDKIVKTNTDEYRLGNDLYEKLMLISRLAGIADHYFYLIGSIETEPHFRKRS